MQRQQEKPTPDPYDYQNEISDALKNEMGQKLDELDFIGRLSDSGKSTLGKDYRDCTINYEYIEFDNLNFNNTEDSNIFIISHLRWQLIPIANEVINKFYPRMPSKIIQGNLCEGYMTDIHFSIHFDYNTGKPIVEIIDLVIDQNKPYIIKQDGF